jgi:hypothetical protein
MYFPGEAVRVRGSASNSADPRVAGLFWPKGVRNHPEAMLAENGRGDAGESSHLFLFLPWAEPASPALRQGGQTN